MADVTSTRRGPDLLHGRTGTGNRRRQDEETNVTDRDVAALTWIGEQYAARGDVLRVLLARLGVLGEGQLAERTLRQITERWAKTGLATRHRLLGHQWVVPTRKALHLVGLTVEPWSPVIPRLQHVHAVGIVRLALEQGIDQRLAIPDDGRWVSERELKRDTTSATTKVYDGAVELPDETDERPTKAGIYGEEVERLAPRIAIEVELSRKSGLRIREAVKRTRHGRYLRTVYFAPPEVASFLRGQIDRAQERQRPEHRHPYLIQPLPEVEGVTYGGAS